MTSNNSEIVHYKILEKDYSEIVHCIDIDILVRSIIVLEMLLII